MGRKDRRKKQKQAVVGPDPQSPTVLSKLGWKIVGGGIGTVVLGFIVLCFTDPRGQNFASSLSPILIVAGYALIGVGIVTKDPS